MRPYRPWPPPHTLTTPLTTDNGRGTIYPYPPGVGLRFKYYAVKTGLSNLRLGYGRLAQSADQSGMEQPWTPMNSGRR